MCVDVIDDDVYDDETINNEKNDEEDFQIQSAENDNSYVLVNTRIDYQYRSDQGGKSVLPYSRTPTVLPYSHLYSLDSRSTGVRFFPLGVGYS